MVYWSRFQFNPQTLVDSEWIDDHGLLTMGWMEPTDQYEKRVMLFIEESIRNKLRIRELFEAEVGIHFRRAAAICEMTYVGDFEDIMTVTKSVHMSNSIANDPSADNVERLCWIMYCSSNTVHKKVFGMEMNDHFEELLMQQLGVSYKDDDKGVKGCVSKYYNKMLNDFRTDVKGGMASIAHCVIAKVSSNKPDEVVDASRQEIVYVILCQQNNSCDVKKHHEPRTWDFFIVESFFLICCSAYKPGHRHIVSVGFAVMKMFIQRFTLKPVGSNTRV